jgi:hypothetical protein
MSNDRDDIQEYRGPGRYWRGLHDRHLVPEVAEAEEAFWSDVLNCQDEIAEHYQNVGDFFEAIDSDFVRARVITVCRQRFGFTNPISFREFVDTFKRLVLIHSFDQLNDSIPEASDEPADKRTPKQIREDAYTEWMDDRETSTAMIEQRKRTDANFRIWYQHTLQHQIASDDPMAQVNNAGGSPSSVSQELLAWAEEYRLMKCEDVRKKLSPVQNPLGYQEYARMRDLAANANLI